MCEKKLNHIFFPAKFNQIMLKTISDFLSSYKRHSYLALLTSSAIIFPLLYYRNDITNVFSSKTKIKSIKSNRKFTIIYATSTGTAKTFAHRVLQSLLQVGVDNSQIFMYNVKDYEFDKLSSEDIVNISHLHSITL